MRRWPALAIFRTPSGVLERFDTVLLAAAEDLLVMLRTDGDRDFIPRTLPEVSGRDAWLLRVLVPTLEDCMAEFAYTAAESAILFQYSSSLISISASFTG
jgi:hypothetical protein